MSKYIDLHFHSHYSEGALSPKQIIDLAITYNIKVMSLTDHNTIVGVKEFLNYCRAAKIIGIPGVEFYSTWRQKKLHILGYFLNIDNNLLKASLEELCAKRTRKIEESLNGLKKIGFLFDETKLWETKSKYIGFGQIIRWLEANPTNIAKMKRDLKTDDVNFFAVINHYFKKSNQTRLEETSLPIKKVLHIIKQAGGLAVLAHPGQQLNWQQDYLIKELKTLGLRGLEVVSPYHTWHQVEHYQQLAKKLKLKITGGSDFHSPLKGGAKNLIAYQWQTNRVPFTLYEQLIK